MMRSSSLILLLIMLAHLGLAIITLYSVQKNFDTHSLTDGILFRAIMIPLIGGVSEIFPECSGRSEKCPRYKCSQSLVNWI